MVGLATGRPLLKLLLGEAFQLNEEGWRKLTVRWALFFFALAILNEIVWRNFSESAWVNFKVFGIVPLTILFAMAQIPSSNVTSRDRKGPARRRGKRDNLPEEAGAG